MISNNPPDMAATAAETAQSLSNWAAENPVIENEDKAREIKLFIDRGKLCIDDLEAERKKKNKPLEDEVKATNDHYRGPRETLASVTAILVARLSTFLKAETARREKIATEAAEKLREAERIAREAEQKEQEALKNAEAGELGINVVSVTKEADSRFTDFKAAERAANLAAKEAKVKIGGGFTRSIGLRTKEELLVVDAAQAISDIGMTPEINEAILRGARAYRRLHGELPTGVTSTTEKGL